MSFIVRAFTPGGGEAPEAVAQREAAQARIDAEAVTKARTAPTAPTVSVEAPKTSLFQAGSAPGVKQRAASTASTLLGAAAASGQTSKKSLLGQ